MKILFILIIISTSLFSQDVIDISVKGISNDKNDGSQKDRLEAILDAKRQACEKAGLKIESKTTVENFEVVYDFIESKAETILLPGFQLIDIGYVQDGTYQVVLSGKIKIIEEEEKISAKELRYAKSLMDREKYTQCEAILTKYIDSEDKSISEELKEESFYCYIKWGFSPNVEESYHKFAAYFPDSKYLAKIEKFADFSAKPIYEHSKSYSTTSNDWLDIEYTYKKDTFSKQIPVAQDTIILKDFKQNEKSLLVSLTLCSTNQGDKPITAYELKLGFYDGNMKNKIVTADQLTEIDFRFRTFKPGGSTTFQHSSSGSWFDNFKLKFFQISGDVPIGEGPYTQKIDFKIFQRSF